MGQPVTRVLTLLAVLTDPQAEPERIEIPIPEGDLDVALVVQIRRDTVTVEQAEAI